MITNQIPRKVCDIKLEKEKRAIIIGNCIGDCSLKLKCENQSVYCLRLDQWVSEKLCGICEELKQ